MRESCRTTERKKALTILADLQAQGKSAPLASRSMLATLAALNVPLPTDAQPEPVLLGALVGRARPDELIATLGERLRAWSEQATEDRREAGRLSEFRRRLAALATGEQSVKLPLADALPTPE